MAFHTQKFHENNVHIGDFQILNGVDPTQFPMVAGVPAANIMTINKKSNIIHLVFESVAAYNDPIVGADVDVFIYYAHNQAASFYEHLAFNCAEGRYSILMDNFMGVKFLYLRQNAGTALKAQVVFD